MTKYAAQTSVSVSKSKAEIERLLEKYGAGQFVSGWDSDRALVGFTMSGRQIKFILSLPDKASKEFTHHSKGRRTDEAALKQWEQACRQRWRALALVIKAKLEAVESGISEFDDEFMANIVMPDGQTVSQLTRPQITMAYQTGQMQPLLPDYSKGDDR